MTISSQRSLSRRFLCSARLFQSVVGRKSLLHPFHRHFTAQKKEQLRKKAALFFALFRSSSSHGRFLRSSGLLHPQFSFIPLRSASYAPLLSSSIMSAAPYFFSGYSFAQPSGLAPFGEKPHFALNQG